MSDTGEKLKPVLAALPDDERAELAQFLWDSLPNGSDEEPDAELIAELDRRMAEMDDGKVAGVPAEEVFEKLRKKYG